jgi:soluble lytic murein transglycosylase
MPATAKWAASRVGMKNLMMDRVTDVPINLSLGAYYLRHVLDDLGHPVLATAGYNAGPGRARRWRAETPLEGAIYAESIPFNETRDYVKKVMANAWFYARQMGPAKTSLKEMMGNVPGRGGIGSAPSAVWGGAGGIVGSAAGTASNVEPVTAVLNNVPRTE